MAALLSMAACTTKPMPAGEEKEYPEALFTFGELADVELEMPEETWQKIIKKASDKNYYECAVTINSGSTMWLSEQRVQAVWMMYS